MRMTVVIGVCHLVCSQVPYNFWLFMAQYTVGGSDGNCSTEFQFCLSIPADSPALISQINCSPHTVFIPTFSSLIISHCCLQSQDTLHIIQSHYIKCNFCIISFIEDSLSPHFVCDYFGLSYL